MEDRRERYQRAQKRIKEEKGFYSHLTAYLIINTALQLFYSGVFGDFRFLDFMPWWVRFTTPTLWGISLLIHWVYVFKGFGFIKFFKNWEERKIKEFMEQEEQDLSVRFRENENQLP